MLCVGHCHVNYHTTRSRNMLCLRRMRNQIILLILSKSLSNVSISAMFRSDIRILVLPWIYVELAF